MRIIIARYNENIEWTKQFPNVTIANKGPQLPTNYNAVTLQNVGREGHTYYKYICDNYDNLDNYTIFLQGNPFDHSPNIINNLKKLINKSDLRLDFGFLSEQILNTNLNGCPHHSGLPLKEVYTKLFNTQQRNTNFEFGAGAQFIVSKKSILRRPKEFYLKIVEMLQNSVNPIEGFVIERFHGLIFR